MIEIIPNWHPLFVHFTVGLLSISAVLFVVGAFVPATASWKEKCLTVARWNLWIGAAITVGTVLAGWQAYGTVVHDEPSHAAMTDHRNWALVTASLFILLALWAYAARHRRGVSSVFILSVVVASGLLATTGFKGGEAVYRYGLGVMSLPKVSGDGGHGSHSHGDEAAAHEEAAMEDDGHHTMK
jgi:uncharacterized membrane protein